MILPIWDGWTRSLLQSNYSLDNFHQSSVWSRCKKVNLYQNTSMRNPIACKREWDMGCLSRAQHLVHVCGCCAVCSIKWYPNHSIIGLQYAQNRHLNTLRSRQNGCHFPDDIFKCIFLNENVRISIKISLKLVPKDPIENIPSLVQIMAWRWPGAKPLSEPMMVSLLLHIYSSLGLNELNPIY